MKKLFRRAAVLVMAAVTVFTASVSDITAISSAVSVTASAANVTITESDLEQYQKDWKAHGWVLKVGFSHNYTSKGKKCIKNAQRLLNLVMGESLAIDGGFGSETKRVTVAFQKKYKLTKDGIIGNGTWNKLISEAHKKIKADVVQEKPVTNTAGYDYEAVIRTATNQNGTKGSELGYNVAWCAYYVSDLLREAGVKVNRSANPRDLVISATNSGLGTYYSFRNANVTSLKESGITQSGLKNVVSTSRGEFTPQRGDIIIFRWSDEEPQYNWSHVGIVTGYDAQSKTIYTVEGNTSGGIVDDRERSYGSTVVGFLRIG